MDILIGRNGNQPFALTEPSISKQHAILHVDEATGKMTLRDNNSTNGTYIYANDRTYKHISGETPVGKETIVRLGAKITFKIKELLPEEKPYDITHLRNIYKTWNINKMEIERQSSNIMMLRMASLGLGTVIGIVFYALIPKDFMGEDNEMAGNIVKALGGLLSIAICWFAVDSKNKALIKRKDDNDQFFKTKYRCPKCGYHFGSKIYDNILAEGKCSNPNCKCKFTGH